MRRKRPIWGMRKHQVVATRTYLVSFWEKNQLLGICTTLRIIKNLNCSTNACFLSFQYHPIHLGVEQALAHYFQLVIFFLATYKVRPSDRNHSCQKNKAILGFVRLTTYFSSISKISSEGIIHDLHSRFQGKLSTGISGINFSPSVYHQIVQFTSDKFAWLVSGRKN